jgi:acetylornithine deacetylase/succinyl-diaminopimelate desuccinylase-like protein
MKPQKSYLIARNQPTVTLAKESVERALGYTPKFKVESGRTDSTYLNEAGIKTVIIGPGEIAHVADEYVNVKRLEEFTQVLAHILSHEK